MLLTCHVLGHPVGVLVDYGFLAVLAMLVVSMCEDGATKRKRRDDGSKHSVESLRGGWLLRGVAVLIGWWCRAVCSATKSRTELKRLEAV